MAIDGVADRAVAVAIGDSVRTSLSVARRTDHVRLIPEMPMKTKLRDVRVWFGVLAVFAAPLLAQRPTLRGVKSIEPVGSAGIHFGGRVTIEGGGRHRHVHDQCCRRWVPARTETVTERVWIPARCERVWVPPAFQIVRDHCGRERRVCIREGYWQTIEHPGRFECVTRQVEIPGYWETVCGR